MFSTIQSRDKIDINTLTILTNIFSDGHAFRRIDFIRHIYSYIFTWNQVMFIVNLWFVSIKNKLLKVFYKYVMSSQGKVHVLFDLVSTHRITPVKNIQESDLILINISKTLLNPRYGLKCSTCTNVAEEWTSKSIICTEMFNRCIHSVREVGLLKNHWYRFISRLRYNPKLIIRSDFWRIISNDQNLRFTVNLRIWNF